MKSKQTYKKLVTAALVFLVFSVGAILVLFFLHRAKFQKEKKRLEQVHQQGITVEVVRVERSSTNRHILLLGESRPFYSVMVFARVSGYMTQLLADIGDDVKKGQLLAYIESPEAEQSYNSAKANAVNLQRIAQRHLILFKERLISAQTVEQAITDAKMAEAHLKTQEILKNYQRIEAPFDGQIDDRFLDAGSLVQNASNSPGAAPALFSISNIDRLRIFIYLDQSNAPFVHPGDPVEIFVPGRSEIQLEAPVTAPFRANVTQIAGKLDPRTRTLLVEIQMDNHERKIIPGSFLRVRLTIKTPPLLELPVEALVISKGQSFVPIVNPQQKIHYAPIELASNDGKRIFIQSGLEEGQQVAINVGNSLQEGQRVNIATTGMAKREMGGKAEPDTDH